MTLTIDNPFQISLPFEADAVIRQLFLGYKRVILLKTFTEGFSGGQVLKLQGIRHDGIAELPTAAKIAPISQIEKEYKAYQTHIDNRLFYVAYLTAEPVILNNIGWGGLRYALMGGEKFEVSTFLDYITRDDVSVDDVRMVVDYLMRTMYDLWHQNAPKKHFSFGASYSHLLPVYYRIHQSTPSEKNLPKLRPKNLISQSFDIGTQVEVSGFVVNKINLQTQTMTLQDPNVPEMGQGSLIRLWFSSVDQLKTYKLLEPIKNFSGIISETRHSRLSNEVEICLGEESFLTQRTISPPSLPHIQLNNPLFSYQDVLNSNEEVKVASIHGDFNLGNIIVEMERRLISLIDFSEARQDHVLHDLLRLEREIITRLLPQLIASGKIQSPISMLAYFYQQLDLVSDQTALNPPNFLSSELKKCWVILSTIRQEVRYYLFQSENFNEYYRGLFLYLLGSLKFKNLTDSSGNNWPKKLAFWGSAFLSRYLSGSKADASHAMQEIAIPFVTHQQKIFQEQSAPKQFPLSHMPPSSAILPPGSRMPFGRNPTFTGREAELMWIASTFEEAGSFKVSAITGLGGLGKTQLVTEFVYRYGRYFEGVFWLNFANPTGVPAEIAACGGSRFMDLRPDFSELKQEEQLNLVLAKWAEKEPILLILDNCEDPNLLKKWHPQIQNCCILLTSRRSQWPDIRNIYRLKPLNQSDSLLLLRNYYRDEDDNVLADIAVEVGHLPLALHIVGSYLKENRGMLSPTDYLVELRQHPFEKDLLESDYEPTRTGQQHSIARTFSLSYQQLKPKESIDNCALAVLDFAACLAPGEPIDRNLISTYIESAKPNQADRINQGIERLSSLGLLLGEIDQKRPIRLHRLVLDFIRHVSNKFDTVRADVETIAIKKIGEFLADGEMVRLQRWQQHFQAVVNSAQDAGHKRGAQLGLLFAKQLNEMGDFRRSKTYIAKSLELCEEIYGPQHITTAKYRSFLGHVFHRLNKRERSWSCLEQALTVQEKELPPDDPEIAVTLNFMGFILQLEKQLQEASTYHSRALEIRKNAFGMHNEQTAESLTNLAYIYLNSGRPDDAEINLKQAMAVFQKLFGEKHPKTVSLMQYLGELADNRQDKASASRHYLKVLHIRRKTLPQNHPGIARTLDCIGKLERKKGNLGRAYICLKHTLDIRRHVFGEENSYTITSQQTLDDLIKEMGDNNTFPDFDNADS